MYLKKALFQGKQYEKQPSKNHCKKLLAKKMTLKFAPFN